MPVSGSSYCVRRRAFLGGGLAAGALQVASPFVRIARAADAVKIGLDNPLTGPVGSLGKNELIGCQMAIDEINAKGGVFGRPVQLIVEDSTSGDAGTAVMKARKLIDGDKVDFLLGNDNSALALAMAQVSNEKGILHIGPAATLTLSPAQAATGTCFASVAPLRWRRTPSPARWSRISARSSTTSRPTTPLATRLRRR